MLIKEIPTGNQEKIELLLSSIEQKEGKNGSYCSLTLSDGDVTINANMWQTKKNQIDTMLEKAVEVDLKVQEFNGRSYVVKNMKLSDSDITNFIRKTPETPDTYRTRILDACRETAKGRPICDIVHYLYTQYEKEILKSSAAKGMHHNLRGGLLYHTASIIQNAMTVADTYPYIDKGLLICAAALHDIGKITELDTTELGDASYSFDGNLFGHAVIGIRMVDEAIAFLKIEDTEETKLLKHCIASHHGHLDWGAITTPMIPEAKMLFMLDDLDASMYEYHEAIEALQPGTFSEKAIFGIDSKVYRRK